MPSKILLVTTDEKFISDFRVPVKARDFELVVVSNPVDAAAKLAGPEPFAALIADDCRLNLSERLSLLEWRRQKPELPFFILETLGTLSPSESGPVRRLAWPFPAGFSDQVRAAERPVIFLADKALTSSGAIQSALAQTGLKPLAVPDLSKIAGAVREAQAATARASGPSLMSIIKDQPIRASIVVIAPLDGEFAEAAAADAEIRRQLPDSVCYYLSSLDPVRALADDPGRHGPIALMREQAGRAASILFDSSQLRGAPKQKDTILLVDNYRPTLDSLAGALKAAGYEVTAAIDGEQALRLLTGRGVFHLAVIGTALSYAQMTGIALAQKLRERDPDIRIIFMIDRYPIQAALQGVSQVVELGLDDALIKPVETSRLLFSVQRALERRFLLLENARLLKEVQESARKLAQINSFQSKFFAMVAHDVKNPLTAILGYSEVLEGKLAAMAAELQFAKHIRSAAKTLNFLISDLVDLAAIESGKLRVNLGPMDLSAVLSDVKSRVEVAAKARHIEFAVESPVQLPELRGDPARLGQVIQNLSTNAIQYTKEGGRVTVSVEAKPDWVTVSVIDTGIGISKEDLPRVFERFFQTAEAQAMRKAGFGLGLKIAREIIQLHGGEIGVESELGRGSRFFFMLPVSKSQNAPAQASH